MRGLRILGPTLALAASACWVPLEQGDIINSRLDKLETATADQTKRLDDLQKSIEQQEQAVKDRVAAVDKKIAELNQASRRSGADLGVSVTRIQDDLAKARGDLEVEQHKLGELEQTLGDLQHNIDTRFQNVDTRFAALRGRGALDEADAKQLIEGLPRQDDKAAFLALAQQQEQKSPGVARAIYDEYLRRFPGDASAATAALRSGALAADQQRWKESFVAYGWVYKNAPRSDAAPDAMLGMATAMFELDELKADAPAMLKELADKYPKSAAAAKARAKLAELKKAAPAPRKPAPAGATKRQGGK